MAAASQVKSTELSRKLATILDKLLTTGNWESSLFLRNASKRLFELKEEAEKLASATNVAATKTSREITVPKGKTRVFISLYQIDGDNLHSWLNTIKSLSSYNVSRPTYHKESSVKELISSKVDMDRHGYVVAVINDKDIINIDPPLVDTMGHELLILKEDSVQLSNLSEFIHANKRKYAIKNNELIFIEEVDRK